MRATSDTSVSPSANVNLFFEFPIQQLARALDRQALYGNCYRILTGKLARHKQQVRLAQCFDEALNSAGVVQFARIALVDDDQAGALFQQFPDLVLLGDHVGDDQVFHPDLFQRLIEQVLEIRLGVQLQEDHRIIRPGAPQVVRDPACQRGLADARKPGQGEDFRRRFFCENFQHLAHGVFLPDQVILAEAGNGRVAASGSQAEQRQRRKIVRFQIVSPVIAAHPDGWRLRLVIPLECREFVEQRLQPRVLVLVCRDPDQVLQRDHPRLQAVPPLLGILCCFFQIPARHVILHQLVE
jgi:hypothetical protein